MSSTSFSDINITDYSDRSVVVRGDTRKYKEDLKKLGGKYNGRLADGPGWIFPKSGEKELKKFVLDGVRIVSESDAKAGEERTKKWGEQREQENKYGTRAVSDVSNVSNISRKEYQLILTKLSTLSDKLDRVLEAVSDGLVIEVSGDDSESEDDVRPSKRLLR